MTYGSWVSNDPAHQGMPRGMWPAYPEDTADFRRADWLHTAVRTWKKWLWDLVDDRDFRDESGSTSASPRIRRPCCRCSR